MGDNIPVELKEFVQSLDFNEADDLLLDEISDYKSNIKYEKVISNLPNGGKIVEFHNDNNSNEEYQKNINNDMFDDLASWDDYQSINEAGMDEHQQKERCYFNEISSKMIDISGDNGVLKKLIHAGIGDVCPKNALCRIHYSAFLRDEIDPFDSTISRGKHCLINIGYDENGLPGLLIGLKTMQKGETSQFLVTPKYAYGSLGCPPRVPPYSHILFEVEMLGFIDRTSLIEYTKATQNIDDTLEQSSLSIRDIVHVCNTLILEGNDHFHNNHLKAAIRCYGKALRLTETCCLHDNDDENVLNEVCKRIFLNVSLCCIHLKKHNHAKGMCLKVLDIDPDNLKANFRLGQIYKFFGDFEQSRKYLNKCLQISPNNLSVSSEIKSLDLLVGACNRHLKEFSQQMFGLSDSSIQKTNLELFKNSSLFRQELYDHFYEKLSKFTNIPLINQLNLPNDFSHVELKHFELACSHLPLAYTFDNENHSIKITKKLS